MSTTPNTAYSQTGKHVFARLINMRDKAGHSHYDRVVLCRQLLADRAWVHDPSGGGGDEGKALDLLEAKAFPDLCGLIDVTDLLNILTHFPEEADWQRRDFDFKRMKSEISARRKAEPRKPSAEHVRCNHTYVPPEAIKEVIELTPAKAAAEYSRVFKAEVADRETVARLREEVVRLQVVVGERDATIARLREEIALLRGRAKQTA